MDKQENILEPDEAPVVPRPEKGFFEIDSSRATLKEYSWGTPLVFLPIVMIIKLFRIRIPSSTDDPPVSELGPFEVPELPENELAHLSTLKIELESLGFSEPLCHRIEDPLHSTLIDWMTFRHFSGKAFARIHYRVWTYNQKIKICVFPIFYTELADGRFIVSSAGKPDTLAPPSWIISRKRDLPAAQLWESHQKLVENEGGDIRLVNDGRDLHDAIARQHAEVTDFHLKRGFFDELSEEEELRISQSFSVSDAGAPKLSLDDASVINEIRRLENKHSSWASLFLMAAVTLVLFITLGAIKQPVKFILILVLVLFVHELGHFIVMKLMGYKNLRMFFIPFLGAAVSGQNYNLPGWKQAIVSLAGPLPGIALGIITGIASSIWSNDFLKELSLMLLVINGFNLLPIMPLDGGRILHTVLFCRHPVLNVFSRIMAAITFFLLGLVSKDNILTAIGAVMAIGIPMAYKSSKIAVKLRNGNLFPAPGAASIPDSTALKILGEIRMEFPRGMNLRSKAQMIMHIFETLNARPPNWIVSIVFVIVLVFSLLITALTASLMLVAKSSNIGNFVTAAVTRPLMSYNIGTIKVLRSEPKNISSSGLTVGANFETKDKAVKVFETLGKIAPKDSSVVLFGQSVLLDMPPTSEEEISKWFKKLEREGAQESFAVREGFNMYLTLSFLMPTLKSAKELEEELKGYLAFSLQGNLIAPWSPEWDLSKKQIQDFKKARETYGKLISSTSEPDQKADAESKELNRKLQDALRRSDSKEAEILEKRQMEIWREKQKRLFDKIRSTPGADTKIVEMYQEWYGSLNSKESNEKSKELWNAMGSLMGIAESTDGKNGISPSGVKGGWVSSKEGLLINFTCFSFNSPSDGISAIAAWLEKLKPLDVKYNIYRERNYSGTGEGYDED